MPENPPQSEHQPKELDTTVDRQLSDFEEVRQGTHVFPIVNMDPEDVQPLLSLDPASNPNVAANQDE